MPNRHVFNSNPTLLWHAVESMLNFVSVFLPHPVSSTLPPTFCAVQQVVAQVIECIYQSSTGCPAVKKKWLSILVYSLNCF